MSKEIKREKWLDILKGILIILVIMGHIVTTYHSGGQLKDSRVFNTICDLIYTFHMPLFIFVSGYLYQKSKNTNTKSGVLIKKRLINYGIPYVIFSIFFCLFKMSMAPFTNNTVSLLDLAKIPIYPLSFMWFIYAVMLMEIVQDLIKTRKLKYFELISSFTLVVSKPLLSRVIPEVFNFSDSIISDFSNNWFYFVIGVWFGNEILLLLKSVKKKAMMMCLSCFTFIVLYCIVEHFDFNLKIIDILLAIVGSVPVILLSLLIDENKFMEYLGRITLPIYVLHPYCLSSMRVLLNRFNIPGGGIPMALGLVVGIVIPIVILRITKKLEPLDFVFYPGRYIGRREKNEYR